MTFRKQAKEKGHFGDIMSVSDIDEDIADSLGSRGEKQELGLVTRQGKNAQFASFTGLERILLNANGNLQRLFASYFNENVEVVVLKNEMENVSLSPVGLLIHRKVLIQTCSRLLCTAYSTITISNPEICARVSSRAFGIGQLFRYLNILPFFTLLEFGRSVVADASVNDESVTRNQDRFDKKDGAFWRLYRLDSTKQQGVECLIREEFEPIHSSIG